MTTGQKVSFEFCGTNYTFMVNQALLEGQDDSQGLVRGIISSETYFVFEASPNSGIKVLLNISFIFFSHIFWEGIRTLSVSINKHL